VLSTGVLFDATDFLSPSLPPHLKKMILSQGPSGSLHTNQPPVVESETHVHRQTPSSGTHMSHSQLGMVIIEGSECFRGENKRNSGKDGRWYTNRKSIALIYTDKGNGRIIKAVFHRNTPLLNLKSVSLYHHLEQLGLSDYFAKCNLERYQVPLARADGGRSIVRESTPEGDRVLISFLVRNWQNIEAICGRSMDGYCWDGESFHQEFWFKERPFAAGILETRGCGSPCVASTNAHSGPPCEVPFLDLDAPVLEPSTPLSDSWDKPSRMTDLHTVRRSLF
jgi:hypothetical protein